MPCKDTACYQWRYRLCLCLVFLRTCAPHGLTLDVWTKYTKQAAGSTPTKGKGKGLPAGPAPARGKQQQQPPSPESERAALAAERAQRTRQMAQLEQRARQVKEMEQRAERAKQLAAERAKQTQVWCVCETPFSARGKWFLFLESSYHVVSSLFLCYRLFEGATRDGLPPWTQDPGYASTLRTRISHATSSYTYFQPTPPPHTTRH